MADHEGLAEEAQADGELEGACVLVHTHLHRQDIEPGCGHQGADQGEEGAAGVSLPQDAALLDGLTLQATLLPDRYPPRLLRQVLRRHLDALRAGS
ncbi:TetR family transcriptional regulator C-terminal domain-containing protein [Streptomyces sp. NPDC020883]|uniref:TetR family transcriptional regulator C-terminal domain-containing protein n=1 Tax=Streptomyces sp. NPDC020883 TaxID=3365099 RepID=UPI0037AAC174